MTDTCDKCENIYIKLFKLTFELRTIQKNHTTQNFIIRQKEAELDKHLAYLEKLLKENNLI